MNSTGRIFRVSLFGESHGNVVGTLIDGCPPGMPLSANDFTHDLLRRRPGAKGTTGRKDEDSPEIISGLYKGFTTGAPLAIVFKNKDFRESDYEALADLPRPGHADFAARAKYKGFNDSRGGGIFSGRMTLALVAAGVIAKKILEPALIKAELIEAGGEKDIEQTVEKALRDNDSIGGLIKCRISKIPPGLGEPFFDSVESVLAHVLYSIPGLKALEFGDLPHPGKFESASLKGSEYNDELISISGNTRTNHAGGINGGISNGNDIVFTVGFRPAASISKPQTTINVQTMEQQKLIVKGRHDACYALRAPVVVESAAAIALADLFLISKAYL